MGSAPSVIQRVNVDCSTSSQQCMLAYLPPASCTPWVTHPSGATPHLHSFWDRFYCPPPLSCIYGVKFDHMPELTPSRSLHLCMPAYPQHPHLTSPTSTTLAHSASLPPPPTHTHTHAHIASLPLPPPPPTHTHTPTLLLCPSPPPPTHTHTYTPSLSGIYGMNFDNMPELHWRYGYGYCYVLFVGVVLLALLLMWYNGLIKVGRGVGGG